MHNLPTLFVSCFLNLSMRLYNLIHSLPLYLLFYFTLRISFLIALNPTGMSYSLCDQSHPDFLFLKRAAVVVAAAVIVGEVVAARLDLFLILHYL